MNVVPSIGYLVNVIFECVFGAAGISSPRERRLFEAPFFCGLLRGSWYVCASLIEDRSLFTPLARNYD